MDFLLNTEVNLLPEGKQGAALPTASAPSASQTPMQPQIHTHVASSIPKQAPHIQPQRPGLDQPVWSVQAPDTAAYSSVVTANGQRPFQQQYAPVNASVAQPDATPVFRPGPVLPGPVRQQQVMPHSLQGAVPQGPFSQGLQSGLPTYGGQGHSGGQQAYRGPNHGQASGFTGLLARPTTGQQGLSGQGGTQPGYSQYITQGPSGGQSSMQHAYMPASSSGQVEVRPAGQAAFQAGNLHQGAPGMFPRPLSQPGMRASGPPHSMPGLRPPSHPGMQGQQQMRSTQIQMRPTGPQAYRAPPGPAAVMMSEGHTGGPRPAGPGSGGFQAALPASTQPQGMQMQGQQRKGLFPAQPLSGPNAGVPNWKRPGPPVVDWLGPGASIPPPQPYAVISDRKVRIDPEGKDSTMYVLLRRWVRNDPNLVTPNDCVDASGMMAEEKVAGPKPASEASPSSRIPPAGVSPKQGHEAPATPPPIERQTDALRARNGIEDLMDAHKVHWLKVRSYHLARKAKRLDSIQQRLATVIPDPSLRSNSPSLS